jgi:hypothetical protein
VIPLAPATTLGPFCLGAPAYGVRFVTIKSSSIVANRGRGEVIKIIITKNSRRAGAERSQNVTKRA